MTRRKENNVDSREVIARQIYDRIIEVVEDTEGLSDFRNSFDFINGKLWFTLSYKLPGFGNTTIKVHNFEVTEEDVEEQIEKIIANIMRV